MDIKTLEYMDERVKKGKEIQNEIKTLLYMKEKIKSGTEIRIDLCGSPYQSVLGHDNVEISILYLIQGRLEELQKDFERI